MSWSGLERREDFIAWCLHAAVADKLRHLPESVMPRIPGNIAAIRSHIHGHESARWMDEWQTAYDHGPQALIAVCQTPGTHGNDLRQVGPFLGVLTQAERVDAIHRGVHMWKTAWTATN